MSSQFLLIKFQFLLESRQLINHHFLRISKLLDDHTSFSFLLSKCEFKILSLRFENLSKLNLFVSQLLDLFFQVLNSFSEFLLLLTKFTQNGAIKLLVSSLLLHICSIIPNLWLWGSGGSIKTWRVNWSFVHTKS